MSNYNYEVSLPIIGYVIVSVESDTPLSEPEAIDAALNTDISTANIEEWDVHTKVVSGNIFHGVQNCAEVLGSWEEEYED